MRFISMSLNIVKVSEHYWQVSNYVYKTTCTNWYYMEDIESKKTLIIEEETTSQPIKCCNFVCRLQESELCLYELPRLCAVLSVVKLLCAISVLFMRPTVTKYQINIRILPVFALFASTVGYIATFANLKMGGWGSHDSRFWCDVKIMYVRGFNTVRIIIQMLTKSILFVFLVLMLNIDNPITVNCFVVLAVVLAEWQAGVAENQNQYDVKMYEKFVKDGLLSIEMLHFFQKRHPKKHSTLAPFFLHVGILTYIVTIVLVDGTFDPGLVFAMPIVVSIAMYIYILPVVLQMMYYKNVCTFCQMEVYKMSVDMIVLPIIVMFTLV